MLSNRSISLVILCVVSLAMAGCVTIPRASFTADEEAAAAPPGFGVIRYDQRTPALADMLRATLKPDAEGNINALALSGGGANGAYGAGLLSGWTASGRRPTFQVVTGISTGALTAPFAFLGPDWDPALRRAYLGKQTQEVLQSRGPAALLTPGFYSRKPLEELVHSYITDDMLRAIAAEHAKGRRLLVATTNLDTEQLVVWDMGAIASRGGPEAKKLFEQVLVASASIPGLFAPSMIDVQSGGRTFAEMHVDGETESAFFAVPQTLFLAKQPDPPPYKVRLFIIVNAKLEGKFEVTPDRTLAVGWRAVDAVIKANMRSVLISTFQFCRQYGCELEVASLPENVDDAAFNFKGDHLQSLFDAGVAGGTQGTAWSDQPDP
ncbi:MAG TPA: patatin-like phospholipase family protein [Caulobacteraceae bacterium]